MYTPNLFKISDPELIRAFIEENNFGIIVSSVDGTSIQETHTPFLLLSKDSKYLSGHMARANPQWKGWVTNQRAKVIFHGPHCYISPNYYQSEFNVPTWNYTAVSVEGEIEFIEDIHEQKAFMHWLVNEHEQNLPQPWKLDEENEQYIKLFKAVVFFRVRITCMTAKFKLNQNKSEADRESVIGQLSGSPSAFERRVAELIKENLEATDETN